MADVTMGNASMDRSRRGRTSMLEVRADAPVIATPHVEDGRNVVRYAVEDEVASPHLDSVLEALALAGAWDDLDWDEAVEAVDRIRRESRPTPLIESLAG